MIEDKDNKMYLNASNAIAVVWVGWIYYWITLVKYGVNDLRVVDTNVGDDDVVGV